jgi:hypothetical protein
MSYESEGSSATYIESSCSLHLLLLKGSGSQAPAAGVEVTLHDATLDLGNNAVVTGSELDS